MEWIRSSSLPVSTEQINGAINNLQNRVGDSFGAVTARVLSGAALAVEVLAGPALALVVLFFLPRTANASGHGW